MFLRHFWLQSRGVFSLGSQVKRAFKTAVVDRWTILEWSLKRKPLEMSTLRNQTRQRRGGVFSCFRRKSAFICWKEKIQNSFWCRTDLICFGFLLRKGKRCSSRVLPHSFFLSNRLQWFCRRALFENLFSCKGWITRFQPFLDGVLYILNNERPKNNSKINSDPHVCTAVQLRISRRRSREV